jgi:hypothetical protein
MSRQILCVLAGATLAAALSAHGAEVFRWVDGNGNVFYSDAEPLDVDSDLVQIGPSEDEQTAMIQLTPAESATADLPDQPPLVVAMAATDLGPCARARQQLTLLHADVAVFLSDDGLWEGSGKRNGERSWLADASRPNAIRAARDEVLRNCSNPASVAEELAGSDSVD